MERSTCPGKWTQRTIEAALSVLRLMRIMHAAGDVELRLPARECPACKRETEVFVVPESLCSDCWSRNAIAAWKVMPRFLAGNGDRDSVERAGRLAEGEGRVNCFRYARSAGEKTRGRTSLINCGKQEERIPQGRFALWPEAQGLPSPAFRQFPVGAEARLQQASSDPLKPDEVYSDDGDE
jgi:hypothetical protein